MLFININNKQFTINFMSKKIKLIALILIGFLSLVKGQDTTYVYFDQDWQNTKSKKAKYILRQTKQEKGFLEELSTSKGLKIYSIECSSINPYIEDGISLCYDDNGNLIEKGYFKDGYPTGIWSHINPETGKIDSINYTNVNKNNILNKNRPNEDVFVVVEKMPTFPNNSDIKNNENKLDFTQYLNSKRYYPEIAKKRGIRGSVILFFVVDKDGNICDISLPDVLRSKILETEALRIMQDLPKWNPGEQNGKKIGVRLTVPIRFNSWNSN